MEMKNICGKIPVELHEKLKLEVEELGISIPKYLEMVIEEHMTRKGEKPNPSRPKLKLLGHDGNIFSILGDASRLLRCAGMSEQANEMADRVHKSGNYYEALGIISEYVETELSDHREQRRTPRKEVPEKEDTCR